ncbi:BTAD domain-containing putative transcriptional regulator [Streptomyces sp. NPDC050560]|uniref:BTAD domain-containing putative transcriptional regulator n=1 Tax=Streptomyces sp. NPDC050560 TaxID=3365630 RepID=UPI0037A11CFA
MTEGRVGDGLRAARIRAGLTQEEVARRAGISVRTLRHIERGHVRTPRHQSLDRLARVVGYELSATRRPRTTAARPDWSPVPCEIRLLGPPAVLYGGAPVALSPKLRALLGLLAVQPDQIVRHDEIADVLWPDEPPPGSSNLLHSYAARLRRVFARETDHRGGEHRIRTVRGGYAFNSAGAHLDLRDFEERVARAERTEAADPQAALDLYGEALRGRRGRLLQDVPQLWQHPAAVRVAQRHVDVAIDCADLALGLGRPAFAVEHLAAAVHDEPLHESLQARMMLALAGSGRRAAALNLFAELRVRLRQDLGVEPSDEVWRARHAILAAESGEPPGVAEAVLTSTTLSRTPLPAAAFEPRGTGLEPVRGLTVPAQLPSAPTPFIGRRQQLQALDGLLDTRRGDGASAGIGVVHGPREVGKSALAVRWAHQRRGEFPDGQLYANLRASTERPLQVATVLTRFLHSLGVRDEWLPDSPEESSDLLRSLTAGRRFLVLLDDVGDPDQVRPLLPGTPGNLVLATGRTPLTGLVAREGAIAIPVGVLTPPESYALVEAYLGVARTAAEPGATAELAALCGHLPLTLRTAAVRIAGRRPLSIGAAAAELRGTAHHGPRAAATAAPGYHTGAPRTPSNSPGKTPENPGGPLAPMADTGADSAAEN